MSLKKSKGAVRVLSREEADQVRQHWPDRIIGSRYVCTRKVDENGSRLKARWCVQGHKDPDVLQLVSSGRTRAPTVSQTGRMLTVQMIASHGWDLQLGDIKGAFMEAPAPNRPDGPLFASLPRGGDP